MASSTVRNVHGKRSSFQSEFTGNGASKRRNLHDETDRNVIGSEDTVYRYLCPVKKTGSIIGKGGEIAKQIRSETKSNMRINEALPGCEERVVTIYSTSDELNHFGDDGEIVCPALDALFKVHDMIVAEVDEDDDDDLGDKQTVTVRMLVPFPITQPIWSEGTSILTVTVCLSPRSSSSSSSTSATIMSWTLKRASKAGQTISPSSPKWFNSSLVEYMGTSNGGAVISEMRSVTRANIRILQKENVPNIAREDEEMVQITGNPDAAMKALTQVILRLRANAFDMNHGLVLLPTSFPYISQVSGSSNKPKYAKRDGSKDQDYGRLNLNSKRRNHVS
uniref:K Homology domain-containing protein n=1 Tax=Brassica oleracea var. oleracea TaxID=109376 RepID=A0A0D3CA17_BRAOL